MSAAASSTCAAASARSAASAGEVSVATSSTSRPSPVRSIEPSTRRPPRRRRRAQLERWRCARLVDGRERRAEDDRQLDRARLGEPADEHRERAPAEREDVVGVQRAAEELQVVGEHEGDADEHERHQVDADRAHAPEADRRCAGERDGRRRSTSARAGRSVPSGRPLSSSRQCAAMPTASVNAASVQARRAPSTCAGEAGAERHVGEVPRRVREVQDRDAVAQAAWPERVERDALGVTGQRAPPTQPVRRRD